MHQPFARVEDQRLVSGRGRYTADIDLPGQAHAVVLRSPHAHAKLGAIDAAAALAAPGALAVITGADEAAAGWGGAPAMPVRHRDGSNIRVPHYPALAQQRVRFVGQPVALMIAESAAAAQDAAELIEIVYEELPSVTDVRRAVEPGAPQLHGNLPGNVAVDYVIGDKAATDAAFARAAHVTRLTAVSQRLVVCAMEPRAALAVYDKAADAYTLYAGTQGATALRDVLSGMTKLPKEKLRVVTGDVGGGFGMKTPPYPEYLALLLAARRVGRPVKWVGGRNESFLSDSQGRDTVMSGELALDPDGKFLGLRIRTLANGGAYLTPPGAYIATANFAVCLASVYATPALDVQATYVVTNTVPVGPYRGAGRPEAAYIVERLVDRAARELKLDAIALRRRNLIPPAAMPYTAPNNAVYDSGEFTALLDKALAISDPAGFAARRRASAARGLLRGRGIAMFLEVSGGAPAEFGGIRFDGDVAELYVGGGSTGQGHETVYRRILAERWGVAPERIRVVQGDTARVPRGLTSTASRTTIAVGAVTVQSAARVLEKGRHLAAHRLETSVEDIEYARGEFRVAGTDRGMSLWALAAWAKSAPGLPAELSGGLDVDIDVKVIPNYPNGCHVAEVEVDPDTGAVTVLSYVAVDDSGIVLDHTLVEAQIHGGLAQGLGQVLLENAVYDSQTGQLLTGSFMDYGLPRADDMPEIRVDDHPVPCTTNPLGVKGVGEAGTTGALPTIVHAALDALAPLGIDHLDMPLTPERVWRAMRDAKARRGGGG
jgi:carbon-monoxide dehydrogenase large subunit